MEASGSAQVFFKFCSTLALPHREIYHLYLFSPPQLLHVVDFVYFSLFHPEFGPVGGKFLFAF